MPVLLSAAAARQPPRAAAAQEAHGGPRAQCPVAGGPGETPQPGPARAAAALPERLLHTGETTAGLYFMFPHRVHAAGLITRLGGKWSSPLFAQKVILVAYTHT